MSPPGYPCCCPAEAGGCDTASFSDDFSSHDEGWSQGTYGEILELSGGKRRHYSATGLTGGLVRCVEDLDTHSVFSFAVDFWPSGANNHCGGMRLVDPGNNQVLGLDWFLGQISYSMRGNYDAILLDLGVGTPSGGEELKIVVTEADPGEWDVDFYFDGNLEVSRVEFTPIYDFAGEHYFVLDSYFYTSNGSYLYFDNFESVLTA